VSLKKLGRYDLVRVLGKGAMGVVYEGRDPNLERRVAIKTVKVENLSEEAAAEYEARFRTEARSAARLQHPNIVSVYDSDRDGDIAFLVMEYIQGDDLKHHLDRGVRYSLEQSLKMIRDLLAALDYAHKAGIVHRDIKPANLLIEPGGRVKLTDFGVARIQDSGEATRTQGSMVGTLKYMSPEQVQGLKIDSRADLFSVGVVLYQLLTDKRPFDGDNDFSIIHQIIGHTPPPPSSFNARLPTAIDAVVARALAKDRDERFATARDFASALQSAIRRAEDATVVPPADPFKKAEPAPSSKGTVPSVVSSGTGTSGSTATVTQELELVYWKDIKDSTDIEDFEGFLQQFPAGIYADLARRRLRKLAGGGSPDQTVLTGPAGLAPAEPDLEATRVRMDASVPRAAPLLAPAVTGTVAAASPPTHAASPVPAAPAAAPVMEPAHAAVATGDPSTPAGGDGVDTMPDLSRAKPLPPAGAFAARPRPAEAPVNAKAVPTESAPPDVRASGKARKLPVAVLAGIGAVAVAGLAVFFIAGRGGEQPVAAASGTPAVVPSRTAVAVPVVATPVPVADSPAPVAMVAAPAEMPLHAEAGASSAKAVAAARKAASGARRSVAAPPSVATAAPAGPMSNPIPSEAREPREAVIAPRPPPPAVATARATTPADTCRDKFFLSRQLCLQEECSKPAFQNVRACVTFREEARLREESKVRN
jgi:serine/threonine protein kinase